MTWTSLRRPSSRTPGASSGGSGLKLKTLEGKDFFINSLKGKVVYVDIWASWCGPCQMYGPEFEKASLLNPGAVFLKVNTETEAELGQEFGIRGIPLTIIFKNGKEVRRQAGAMQASEVGTLLT